MPRRCPVYGPVPSQRLGRSLGVDLVPFKTCSYDCIYCQLGRTTHKTLERKEYVLIGDILEALGQKLDNGDTPDYISLAGSGEPTLNSGIGRLIQGIKKKTRVPVAVLTNGSLLWEREVQDALMGADLVLPSLDVGDDLMFRYVNRPHRRLTFGKMVDGLAFFSDRFPGAVWLEILLLGGVTGIESEVKKIARAVKRIHPARVQINTVGRPPAEEFALPIAVDRMRSLGKIFPGPVDVIGEGPRKARSASTDPGTGTPGILELLGRRPCTTEDIAEGLAMHRIEVIKHLVALSAEGRVERVALEGRNYYKTAGPRRRRRSTR